MDLRSQKVAETGFLHLRSADDSLLYVKDDQGVEDKSKAIGITMYGPGSKPYSKASAARHARLMEKMKRKGKVQQSAAEIAAENAEFLTAVTAQFHHIERDALEGDALYNATYSDLEIGFIAEQANAFVGDWSNFTKGSPKP
jgi:hypothetical protein